MLACKLYWKADRFYEEVIGKDDVFKAFRKFVEKITIFMYFIPTNMEAKMKTRMLSILLVSAAATLFVCGCDVTPKEPYEKVKLESETSEAINIMKEQDPSLQTFFENSYGYAILPKVFKGAFLAGFAYGRGEVYEKGEMVGYCDMKQASGGLSIGGEFYREIIFFREQKDLDKFRTGEYTFAAQVTGVAVKWGAAAKADYKDGMAVFIMTDVGAMVDASLGGQKFEYESKVVLKKVQPDKKEQTEANPKNKEN
jgi:lipid-binding SYLF domain-containing protein